MLSSVSGREDSDGGDSSKVCPTGLDDAGGISNE